ncbi:MAG: hypothetical protein KJ579_03285 [Verrucomicrobia bacterium]|nr:hypothetical protein [Verrucomicrobiota bacterium]
MPRVTPSTVRRSPARRRCALAGMTALLLSGCATAPLEAARENFRRGRLAQAEQALTSEDARKAEKDRVLILMERGTIRQAAGQYDESSRDWIDAAEHAKKLETYSVSKGAASFVVNDSVQAFRGAPYERTLLHAMTALNHFAVTNWDDAAVEARRLIETAAAPAREGFPEDAFSYYVAGLALEMIDDPSNAALLYRKAAAVAPPGIRVDDASGRIGPRAPGETNAPAVPMPRPPAPAGWTHELVCFVLLGHAPPGGADMSKRWHGPPGGHAEIRIGGVTAGRSYPLADVAWLAARTDLRLAGIRAAKTATRVVLKEVIAESVAQSSHNDALGDLIRLLLIGLLEQPDIRRWETLPGMLQVARVPCPPDLANVEVVLRAPTGAELRSIAISRPLAHRRTLWVGFVRDLPTPAPALPR